MNNQNSYLNKQNNKLHGNNLINPIHPGKNIFIYIAGKFRLNYTAILTAIKIIPGYRLETNFEY